MTDREFVEKWASNREPTPRFGTIERLARIAKEAMDELVWQTKLYEKERSAERDKLAAENAELRDGLREIANKVSPNGHCGPCGVAEECESCIARALLAKLEGGSDG